MCKGKGNKRHPRHRSGFFQRAWKRESERLGYSFVDLRKKQGKSGERTVFWINYENSFVRTREGLTYSETLKRAVKMMKKPRGIVLDESHYIKNPTARRTKIATALRKYFDAAYILSATPSEKYEELYSQFRFLIPDVIKSEYPSFRAFKERHMITEMKETRDGRRYEAVTGYKDIETFMELIDPYYYSLTKKVKKHKNYWIEVSTPSESIFDLLETYENFTHAHMAASGYCPIRGEWLYTAKLETLKKRVQEINEPVVIFTNFIHEAETIGKMLKAPVITGATDKDTSVWKDGPLVCTYALSESVDLTKARHMIFFSYPLSWKKFYQAKGRINRISQKAETVFYHMLYTEADKYIIKTIWKKKDVNTSVLKKAALRKKKQKEERTQGSPYLF